MVSCLNLNLDGDFFVENSNGKHSSIQQLKFLKIYFLNSKKRVKTNKKLHVLDKIINLKHLGVSLSFRREEQSFGKTAPADHHYLVVILLTKHL